VTQLAGLQYNPQLSWRISINIYYPAFMIYEKLQKTKYFSWRISINIYYPAFMIYEKLQKTKYFVAILSQFILAVAT